MNFWLHGDASASVGANNGDQRSSVWKVWQLESADAGRTAMLHRVQKCRVILPFVGARDVEEE